jgi:hypothetical protein
VLNKFCFYSCPGNRIIESGWDRGNWFICVVKTELKGSPVDSSQNNIFDNSGIGPTGAMPRHATRLKYLLNEKIWFG